jgi:hypothetical protein
MTGLSAGYCHEISLSNPKRFVTVKDKTVRVYLVARPEKLKNLLRFQLKEEERHEIFYQENSQHVYLQKIAELRKISHISLAN